MKNKAIEVSVDVGHMFTSGIFLTEGTGYHVKVLNTGGTLHEQIFNCLNKAAGKMKMSFNELISAITMLRQSNTVTETILDNKIGQKVAIIVTKGYEKSLYAKNGSVRGVLVPEEMIMAIDEEVDASGKVIKSISEEAFREGLKNLLEWGTQRIAVCLKNSYYNPANEKAAKDIILKNISQFYLGGVGTSCSYELSTIPEDDARLNTTMLDLYFHERLARTYRKTNDELRTAGLKSVPMVKVPSGGAIWTPAAIALDSSFSSSASLLAGTAEVGAFYGIEDLVVVDMGASRCQVGIVKKGAYQLDAKPFIAGFPVDVPTPEFFTIPTGGASIAACDAKGKVQFGSYVGIEPGPACFNQGGAEATVMDADVVLGYIDSANPFYNSCPLDLENARQAIKEKIADKAKISIEEAANQIRSAFETKIGKDISSYLDSKGCDVRKSILLSVGGGGSTHGAGIAAAAGFDRFLTLNFGSEMTAFGGSVDGTVLKLSIPFHSVFSKSDGTACSIDYNQLNGAVLRVTQRITEILKRSRGHEKDKISIQLDLTLRYETGDERIIRTAIDGVRSKSDMQKICDDFRKRYPVEGKSIELLSATVRGEIESTKENRYAVFAALKEVSGVGNILNAGAREIKKLPQKALKGSRKVYWNTSYKDTAVYAYKALHGGNMISGPVIVEQEDSTWVIPEGYQLMIDGYLNGVINKVSK